MIATFLLVMLAAGTALRLGLSGRNVVLSWPANAVGFNLEATESLIPATWRPAPAEPLLTGVDYPLKLPSVGSVQFYRLKSP